MSSDAPNPGARQRARRLLMQALYQHLVGAGDLRDIAVQFREDGRLERSDADYFDELMRRIDSEREDIDRTIDLHADRPLVQLDPVERAILTCGVCELRSREELPFRVVIDEAVRLARRYGSTDGHRYVNAVLDRIARELRPAEFERYRAPPS